LPLVVRAAIAREQSGCPLPRESRVGAHAMCWIVDDAGGVVTLVAAGRSRIRRREGERPDGLAAGKERG